MDALKIERGAVAVDAVSGAAAGHSTEALFRTVRN
jgi:hypothetical protein